MPSFQVVGALFSRRIFYLADNTRFAFIGNYSCSQPLCNSNERKKLPSCLFLNKETYNFAQKRINYRFKVEFLEPALEFLENLDQKSREKVLYNIWKSRSVNDNELFKKLDGEIWEFRTLYNKQYLRLFAFWDKSQKQETVVISTHGILKKSGKTPKVEIERAEALRVRYFNEKQ